VALCIYRIVQEAMQNVIQHSGAGSARVELSAEGNEIRLTVIDDGTGFNIQAARTKGSLGLVSMRERARLVHGQITWESKKGWGMRIKVRVPLSVPREGI
jgi:signal transduction histidine kinase